MKDTHNLLGDGIVLLLHQLAQLAGAELAPFATELGYARYVGEQRLKGGADLDWDNAKERAPLLAETVADGDRLLAEARKVQKTLAKGSAEAVALTKAAELLSQPLLRDVVRSEEGRVAAGDGEGPNAEWCTTRRCGTGARVRRIASTGIKRRSPWIRMSS